MPTIKVETILTRGVVPTVPGADSIAIACGRIFAVGSDAEVAPLAGVATKTIDLAGRAVLPGFIDAHTHFLQLGLAEIGFRIDLIGLSKEDALDRLNNVARERGAGGWVVGLGWDESRWRDRRPFCREDLDRIAVDRPLIAVRLDGHLLIANTAALKRVPPTIPAAEIDATHGVLREEAAFALLRTLSPDRETLREALYAAAAYAQRLGITSVHAMLPPDLNAYMRERGRLPLRVTLCPEVSALEPLAALGVTSGFGDDWLRIGGIGEIFADGSIGAGNAALGEPYADSGERGELNYSAQEITSLIERAEQAGIQTVIHAIGDRAITQVLDAHAAVQTSPDLRHRIEHFELPTLEQIERAGELSLSISMQPNFVGNWSGEEKMYQKRLGKERDSQIDPHRLVVDRGIPLAFGSDCMPISPLYGIHWAVNAPHSSQRLSVEEAIFCYTEAGARLSFEEKEKGRIEAGMLADLVVLDQDPREDQSRISERTVEMTILNGKIVYQRGNEPCE
ncbi:amidohydrolase [Candidatus Bipolaricaulota bacterium]|nr:amidohydrolase [Candidatus Bipolaricaulota bacterium]